MALFDDQFPALSFAVTNYVCVCVCVCVCACEGKGERQKFLAEADVGSLHPSRGRWWAEGAG